MVESAPSPAVLIVVLSVRVLEPMLLFTLGRFLVQSRRDEFLKRRFTAIIVCYLFFLLEAGLLVATWVGSSVDLALKAVGI